MDYITVFSRWKIRERAGLFSDFLQKNKHHQRKLVGAYFLLEHKMLNIF